MFKLLRARGKQEDTQSVSDTIDGWAGDARGPLVSFGDSARVASLARGGGQV